MGAHGGPPSTPADRPGCAHRSPATAAPPPAAATPGAGRWAARLLSLGAAPSSSLRGVLRDVGLGGGVGVGGGGAGGRGGTVGGCGVGGPAACVLAGISWAGHAGSSHGSCLGASTRRHGQPGGIWGLTLSARGTTLPSRGGVSQRRLRFTTPWTARDDAPAAQPPQHSLALSSSHSPALCMTPTLSPTLTHSGCTNRTAMAREGRGKGMERLAAWRCGTAAAGALRRFVFALTQAPNTCSQRCRRVGLAAAPRRAAPRCGRALVESQGSTAAACQSPPSRQSRSSIALFQRFHVRHRGRPVPFCCLGGGGGGCAKGRCV